MKLKNAVSLLRQTVSYNLLLSEPAELQGCVFADSLVTLSKGGQVLGNFTVTVEFARKDREPCMLLHAQSQGTVDHCPCGTTVTGKGKPKHASWATSVRIQVCKDPHVCTLKPT